MQVLEEHSLLEVASWSDGVVLGVQAVASTNALASREEEVGQLQQQVQQADCQVVNLQQAQASIAADASAKAVKLAHLEGAATHTCRLLSIHLSKSTDPMLLLGTEAPMVLPHSLDPFFLLFFLCIRSKACCIALGSKGVCGNLPNHADDQ